MIQKIIPSLVLVLCGSIFNSAFTQELEAYRIYDKSGKKVEFGKMSKELQSKQVILFGELHNNPISHWMQLELTKSLAEKSNKLALGAEMFETDDQLVLDEYLEGLMKVDQFKKEAKVWPNFDTDYLPLLDFAKEMDFPFIATNVPRRYASLVSKMGQSALDSLTSEAKALFPALPYEVTEGDSGYADMRAMMGTHGMGMNVEDFIAAQALKDYTMASFIFRNLPQNGTFIHFNGSFHSQKFSGIYNFLKKENPELKIGVIATVESDDLEFQKEWKILADYIIVAPTSMTKTH
jgi:uncharacterized iron-regulated protein